MMKNLSSFLPTGLKVISKNVPRNHSCASRAPSIAGKQYADEFTRKMSSATRSFITARRADILLSERYVDRRAPASTTISTAPGKFCGAARPVFGGTFRSRCQDPVAGQRGNVPTCRNISSGMSTQSAYSPGPIENLEESLDPAVVECLEFVVNREASLDGCRSRTTVIETMDDDSFDMEESMSEFVKASRSGIGVYKNASGSMCEDVFCTDPGLNQNLISNEGSATISRFFNQDEWERHRNVGRYWRHLFSAHKSIVFLRVLEPVLMMSTAAALVAAWNTFMTTVYGLPALCIVPLAHQLTGGVVSLSLVFRTNNANRRVIDARQLLSKLSKCTRDMTRVSQYIPNEGDCRIETLRHLRAFPYALESHVRKGRTRQNPKDPTSFRVDPMPCMARALGKRRARRFMFYENIPAQVLMDMTQILQRALMKGMSTQMHAQAEIIVKELSAVLAESEKILYTPIPISFTRHTSRILTVWLFTLPLALWLPLGWCMVPAVFLISWVMLGVDEIGIEIEEPFCILPVRPLCDMCDREIVGTMAQALQAQDYQPARKNV